MYCYFMRHNNPRSYLDNRIIKSPNNKKINKLLKYYKTKEQPDQASAPAPAPAANDISELEDDLPF